MPSSCLITINWKCNVAVELSYNGETGRAKHRLIHSLVAWVFVPVHELVCVHRVKPEYSKTTVCGPSNVDGYAKRASSILFRSQQISFSLVQIPYWWVLQISTRSENGFIQFPPFTIHIPIARKQLRRINRRSSDDKTISTFYAFTRKFPHI